MSWYSFLIFLFKCKILGFEMEGGGPKGLGKGMKKKMGERECKGEEREDETRDFKWSFPLLTWNFPSSLGQLCPAAAVCLPSCTQPSWPPTTPSNPYPSPSYILEGILKETPTSTVCKSVYPVPTRSFLSKIIPVLVPSIAWGHSHYLSYCWGDL